MRASHCCGPSRCGAQAPDAQAQRPWLTGSATLRHVVSSRTGARTHVPRIGRRSVNHCTTREAPELYILKFVKRHDVCDGRSVVLNWRRCCLQGTLGHIFGCHHLVGAPGIKRAGLGRPLHTPQHSGWTPTEGDPAAMSAVLGETLFNLNHQ